MPSQDPTTEARAIQHEIDLLNQEKSALVAAWKQESRDMNLPALLEARNSSTVLKKIWELNESLAFWYGQRNALLKEYPRLQREFGKPVDVDAAKRFTVTNRLETRAARTAAERHRRKRLMHPDFKGWCAEQRPQIKASLENWETAAVRARFETRTAPDDPPPPRKPAVTIPSRGPAPADFAEFLFEMEHPLAGWSSSRQEDLWQSDAETRGLYGLWREERAETETPQRR